MSVKILFITDIHQNIGDLLNFDFTSFDYIFCGGDIADPANFDREKVMMILSLLPERTFIVPGNCDGYYELFNGISNRKGNIDQKIIQTSHFPVSGIGKARYLEDDIEVYRNYFIEDPQRIIKFKENNQSNFILHYTAVDSEDSKSVSELRIKENDVFFNRFISFKENEVQKCKMEEELLGGILLIHSPPYGILDRLSGLPHIGSRAIMEYIQRSKPSLVLLGHFHELSKVHKENNIIYFNPGAFKDGFFGVIYYNEQNFSCEMQHI